LKKKHIAAITAAIAIAALYIFNASWRISPAESDLRLLSHRGVHQTYHRQGLTDTTCTAARIDPPRHRFIENTIPSMKAAFSAGADVVELDVHPTTDGYFAVMHDWTLDCRTHGTGETRSHNLAYLKSLDLGYGYTADGETYPLRGQGVGLMPSLGEVFITFPDKQFLINFKSRESREGDMLAAFIAEHPQWRQAAWGVYGGDEPTWRAAELLDDDLVAFSRASVKTCLKQYLAVGWSGYMPEACRNTMVIVPIDIAPWLWGWPHLLVKRFQEAGSEIALLGPMLDKDVGAPGIDTLEHLALVPEQFSGYLWTDKIEIIGPVVRKLQK
jgi:glycerophosphoryl diester phosphodiesterase